MEKSINWPAPAKVNWFLQVNGRRSDGYHNIQTYFQFIELQDRLDFILKEDQAICLSGTVVMHDIEEDLTVRAANLLKSHCGIKRGVEIQLKKNIPLGGGLGGGSSDAATVLVALNALWKLGLTEPELKTLGGRLGADVPVFVSGKATWAEGVGDLFYEENGVEESILLLFPGVNVSTAKIFASSQLTRDSVPIKMEMKNISEYRNDCEPVTKSLYPDVEEALEWLSQYGISKMSGTGSTIFAAFDKLENAKRVISEIPKKWSGVACKTLNRSPLLDRLRTFNVESKRE